MKRASVSFGQSVDDGDEDKAKAKLKYQTLLNEYLELQKECVSRKRKLPAAKQKRETLLAEVRFLRRRHRSLLKNLASNTEKVHLHLPNSDIEEANAIVEYDRDQSSSKAVRQNEDQVPLTKSYAGDKEQERNQQVLEEEPKFANKPINFIVNDKGTGKRKISWPGRVTLKI